MAVLSPEAREEVLAEWMRFNVDACAVTKTDLRPAVGALDDYVNAHAAEINQTLPLPARTALTQSQKASLLTAVVGKRYQKGS